METNYLQCFEELLATLSDIVEDVLVNTFTNGFDPMIHRVFSMRAMGLNNIMAGN